MESNYYYSARAPHQPDGEPGPQQAGCHLVVAARSRRLHWLPWCRYQSAARAPRAELATSRWRATPTATGPRWCVT
ncbi:unnamed protein product [Leptidea sinapis]|uniref:Uncharacterized protein n=1 Tax=Leptidea sinapis TaxID=189913 RepID=A0A5E4R1F7_9NEOP|nr:unnamed protein product [Leptidea sinapis]